MSDVISLIQLLCDLRLVFQVRNTERWMRLPTFEQIYNARADDVFTPQRYGLATESQLLLVFVVLRLFALSRDPDRVVVLRPTTRLFDLTDRLATVLEAPAPLRFFDRIEAAIGVIEHDP